MLVRRPRQLVPSPQSTGTIFTWDPVTPGDTDYIYPYPALDRSDKLALQTVLGTLAPYGAPATTGMRMVQESDIALDLAFNAWAGAPGQWHRDNQYIDAFLQRCEPPNHRFMWFWSPAGTDPIAWLPLMELDPTELAIGEYNSGGAVHLIAGTGGVWSQNASLRTGQWAPDNPSVAAFAEYVDPTPSTNLPTFFWLTAPAPVGAPIAWQYLMQLDVHGLTLLTGGMTANGDIFTTGGVTARGPINGAELSITGPAALGRGLTVTGGIALISGPLTLPQDPTVAQEAATKHYVDQAIANIPGGGGGGVPPLQPRQVVFGAPNGGIAQDSIFTFDPVPDVLRLGRVPYAMRFSEGAVSINWDENNNADDSTQAAFNFGLDTVDNVFFWLGAMPPQSSPMTWSSWMALEENALRLFGRQIVAVADPVNPDDVATKQYVDGVAMGTVSLDGGTF